MARPRALRTYIRASLRCRALSHFGAAAAHQRRRMGKRRCSAALEEAKSFGRSYEAALFAPGGFIVIALIISAASFSGACTAGAGSGRYRFRFACRAANAAAAWACTCACSACCACSAKRAWFCCTTGSPLRARR